MGKIEWNEDVSRRRTYEIAAEHSDIDSPFADKLAMRADVDNRDEVSWRRLLANHLGSFGLDAARIDAEVALVHALATADEATLAMVAEEREAHERRIAKLASGRYLLTTGERAEIHTADEPLAVQRDAETARRIAVKWRANGSPEARVVRVRCSALRLREPKAPAAKPTHEPLTGAWLALAERTGKPFGEGGAYMSDSFADWSGCVALLRDRGMSVDDAERFLRHASMRYCYDFRGHDGPATVEDLRRHIGDERNGVRADYPTLGAGR